MFSLEKHVKLHDGQLVRYSKKDDGTFTNMECQLCDFRETTVSEMDGHVRTIHFPDRLKCTFPVCFKYFKEEEKLELHFEEQHAEEIKHSRYNFL